MENNRVNKPEDCETIDITIIESKYPILFKKKVQELVEDCGMSYEEARKEVEGMSITLELMYSISSGLYGIESDAIESCASSLYNPYTGENLVDWDEYDDDIEYEEECSANRSEYLEGDADTRTGEIFDNYYK